MSLDLFSVGLFLVIIGGLMEGSFSLPLKYMPRWGWENSWGAGSLLAILLIAWPVALLTVPGLFQAYAATSTTSLLLALLFGAGWGAGSIFFGLGLAAVGLSLGFSLMMGMIAVGGSLIPLLMQHSEQLTQPGGLPVLAGIVVMILGWVLCARAGQLKEEKGAGEGAPKTSAVRRVPFARGLAYCLAAGVLSPLLNLAFIYGGEIVNAASSQGADPGSAPNALWALVFTANYGINAGYCVYLMWRRNSFSRFFDKGTGFYWLGVLVMGILWPGGVVVYGVGATRMGAFGAFLGFPILLISSILAGNLLGAITGEWRGSSKRSRRLMIGGIALLFLAIVLLGYSNQSLA